MGFWKSLFQGNNETPEEYKQEEENKNFDILKYDGLRAQRMGRYDYAIRCFEEALKLQNDYETLSYKYQTHMLIGDLDEALTSLEQMAKEEPGISMTYANMANIKYMQENYEEMKAVAEKAVKLDNENSIAHFYLGRALHALEDDEHAISELNKAIEQNDAYVEARLLRAEVFLKMGDKTDQVMADINNILDLNNEDESALTLRARLRCEAQDYNAAASDYQTIIGLDPFNEMAYLELCAMLTEQGKAEEALALLNEALDLKPDFAHLLMLRAQLKEAKGDTTAQTDRSKAEELIAEADIPAQGDYKIGGMEKRNVLGL